MKKPIHANKPKKLVLFDIDGTLIRPLGDPVGLGRFSYAIKETLGIDVSVSHDNWPYNGIVDRGILWDLVKDKGITKRTFETAIPKLIEYFHLFMERVGKERRLYEPIEDAVLCLDEVVRSNHLVYGVLTGNLGHIGPWKLIHAGVGTHFDFGLFGHEAADRIALARQVFRKAQKHFGKKFSPKEIIIIGDTANDVLCARAIGAVAIAVTSGWKVDKDALIKAKPDLLVDSLMDGRVLSLLGLRG